MSVSILTNPKSSKLGYVYCIRDGFRQAVKIGFSNNPERRLSQLQTASATRLEMVSFIPTVKSFETFLHFLNRHRRLSGEWFDDSDFAVSQMFKDVVEAD